MQEYLKLDCHVHTNDLSFCARANVWQWRDFYLKQLPWVQGIIITNHSHSPNLYDSRIMSKQVVMNNYDCVNGLQMFSGIEVNVLRDGSFDVSDNVLNDSPWVAAAIHPLPHEYGEVNMVEASAHDIQSALLKVITSGLVDVIAHPTKHISEEKLKEINWNKLLETCIEHKVMMEINFLALPPEWWLNLVASSGCLITIGSDWHGMYQFRRFRPKELSLEEEAVWRTVLSGGRTAFDSLSHQSKKLYNKIYTSMELTEEFRNYIYLYIKRLAEMGVTTNRVFNSFDLSRTQEFLASPRHKRKDWLQNVS